MDKISLKSFMMGFLMPSGPPTTMITESMSSKASCKSPEPLVSLLKQRPFRHRDVHQLDSGT